MKPIFLIGLPGCGKSTLGRALAKHLGYQFYDLDYYIESRFRSSVSDIFATVGEQEFRRRESVLLREIGEMNDVIIACGGGTPCHGDNMEYMNSNGITVWLQASEPVLLRRIIRAKSRRPMFAACPDDEAIANKLLQLTQSREADYSKASHTFNGDELENRQMIDNSVNRFIKEIINSNP